MKGKTKIAANIRRIHTHDDKKVFYFSHFIPPAMELGALSAFAMCV